LRDAELINTKLRDARVAKGLSTVGKQRSSEHIASIGPAIFLDDDNDVFAREPTLRALGAAAVIYSSFSFGYPKGEETDPSSAGRVVLFVNRSVGREEYGPLWDGVHHLLGSGFDEHGRLLAALAAAGLRGAREHTGNGARGLPRSVARLIDG
jgi:hypothetical protein